MTFPKITGVVVSRDDWGLLAVSITHALMNHVDEVLVLDHRSTDETSNGLRYLQALWPGRIRTWRSNLDFFEQEAATNALAHLALSSRPDWIYVFDSDEFLLTAPDVSLKSILAGFRADQVGLRYSVSNFVSPRSFDEHLLNSYRSLRARSVPSRSYDDSQAYDSLYRGTATFFDFPFVAKLIFRARELSRVTVGAHRVMYFGGQGVEQRDDRIRCAHLTLPSRAKLSRKAQQGESYVRMGMPKNFGWQAQLVYRLQQEGRLDWFWERHSVPDPLVPGSGLQGEHTPPCTIDESLILALEPSLRFLEQGFASDDLRRIGQDRIECIEDTVTAVSIDDVIGLTAALQRQTDVLVKHIKNTSVAR